MFCVTVVLCFILENNRLVEMVRVFSDTIQNSAEFLLLFFMLFHVEPLGCSEHNS